MITEFFRSGYAYVLVSSFFVGATIVALWYLRDIRTLLLDSNQKKHICRAGDTGDI